MTLRLTLLCHASTPSLRAGRFAGDDAIDDIGRRQAEELAPAMARADRATTSPVRAAIETACLLNLAAVTDPLLRGCDFGRWTARSFEEVHAAEPDALAAWRADPSAAPHGGESLAQLMARAQSWLASRETNDGSEIIVGDPLMLRAIIACAIEGSAPMLWHLDLAPLALVRLNRTAGRWHLRLEGGRG